ncbi:MAG TPA: radical SAM protein [Xanthobacteraceae bacterium]|nr:radical SAM protein [Xanthobacteraceae bacterium]
MLATQRAKESTARRRFRVVLVKPSHYDDDGYVIRWYRSPMPANSLASVYGLIDDCARRNILGPDIDIEITAIDETNTRVRVDRIIAEMRANGNFGFVGLVGVQSNQYPRALHIAKPLREAGIPVIIGGFHVSGMLAMFPTMMADLQEALDMGVTLFAGEAEGRMDEVLRDAAAGTLKPLYNYIDDLPALEDAVTPFLPGNSVRKTIGNVTTFDAGRGCPFQCSFCTIINVQGRKSRRRSPDDVERILRKNYEQGIDRFFITDDNFARNKDWEPIFDRIIKLREDDGMDVRFLIQVDTLCHKIPNFVAKAKRAGVTRIFIGLENINPDNLLAAKKRQNKITEYRNMLLAWKAAGIWTYAGYILGFPNDTPESARRDIEIIKKEMPLDVLEFFFLTPLPGSEDHKTLFNKGVPLDPDLNKYDLEHALTPHAHMTKAEWEKLYRDAWAIYYTPEHIETILRRAQACGINILRLAQIILWFAQSLAIEKVHPLQGGFVRLKNRHERRPELPVEPLRRFYPRLVWDFTVKHARVTAAAWRIFRIYRRVVKGAGVPYGDQAMTPVTEDETQTFELFTHNTSAREAVDHARKVKRLTGGADTPLVAAQSAIR